MFMLEWVKQQEAIGLYACDPETTCHPSTELNDNIDYVAHVCSCTWWLLLRLISQSNASQKNASNVRFNRWGGAWGERVMAAAACCP